MEIKKRDRIKRGSSERRKEWSPKGKSRVKKASNSANMFKNRWSLLHVYTNVRKLDVSLLGECACNERCVTWGTRLPVGAKLGPIWNITYSLLIKFAFTRAKRCHSTPRGNGRTPFLSLMRFPWFEINDLSFSLKDWRKTLTYCLIKNKLKRTLSIDYIIITIFYT